MKLPPDLMYVRAIDYASPNGDHAVYIEMERQPDGAYRIVRELRVPLRPTGDGRTEG